MGNVEDTLEQVERHCRERGVNLTVKRKQVLSGLLQSETALSAYELVDYCKNEFGTNIPAMSVYRILGFLEGEHLVHKLNLANKYVACAHITCKHEHAVPQFLICGKCQRVKEISVSQTTIDALRRNVDAAGFQLVSPQLEMNCLCQRCIDNAA